MKHSLVIVMALAGMAMGQTAPASKASAPAKPKSPQASTAKTTESAPGHLSATSPVITLQGFCSASAAKDKSSPDCKTVVTKAQFEKLEKALNPQMNDTGRQALAVEYSRILVLSDLARQRGLENSPDFPELLHFVRMQVLAQELVRNLQEKAKPTPAQVQQYYDQNKQKYQMISVKRLLLPRNRPDEKADAKKPTDDELKSQAQKYRDRLAKGEDFDKLQKEVYDADGFKSPPPPTSIPDWRRDVVPASETQLFDLKQGDVSQPIIEPSGAYIYKIVEKKTVPLDSVKSEIETTLGSEALRKKMGDLTSTIKPELNQAYFHIQAQPLPPGAKPGEHPVTPMSSPHAK